MTTRKYTIDFFRIEIKDQQGQEILFADILNNMIQGIIQTTTFCLDYQRDIWDINRSPVTGRYSAQLRKLRRTDLPEIGEMGAQSQPIILGDNQGVIEKNCFLFDPTNSVLAWHNNLHAATPKILGEVLTMLTHYNIGIYPILRIGSFERLMNNQTLSIKNLDIAFAKPTNPSAFNTNEPISARLLNILSQSGADKLDLKLSIDARMSNSNGGLTQSIRESLNALLNLSPNRARLNVRNEEDGKEFPIDLIADRVRSFQRINVNNSTTILPVIQLFEAMNNAFNEVNPELNEIFNRIP